MNKQWDEESLRTAYAPRARDATRTHFPTCPDPEALLSAIRGEGNAADRQRVLDQALRCPACQRELALLHAVSGVGGQKQSAIPRRFAWQRFVPLAAAASILIAVGIFGVDRWRERGGDNVMRTGIGGEPELISPTSGSAIPAGAITFAWRPVAGALRYTLEVNAADGTVLYTASAGDTILTAPLASMGGGDHRWWVRAHLDDGSERRSVAWILRVP